MFKKCLEFLLSYSQHLNKKIISKKSWFFELTRRRRKYYFGFVNLKITFEKNPPNKNQKLSEKIPDGLITSRISAGICSLHGVGGYFKGKILPRYFRGGGDTLREKILPRYIRCTGGVREKSSRDIFGAQWGGYFKEKVIPGYFFKKIFLTIFLEDFRCEARIF